MTQVEARRFFKIIIEIAKGADRRTEEMLELVSRHEELVSRQEELLRLTERQRRSELVKALRPDDGETAWPS